MLYKQLVRISYQLIKKATKLTQLEMSNLFLKISKIIVLGLLPLFLISSKSKEINVPQLNLNDTYHPNISENIVNELNGIIEFEAYLEKANTGEVTSILKLNFVNEKDRPPYRVELLISKENKSEGIVVGNYVVGPIDGFLNRFDGVFGVINMESLGEKPFFTEKGNIRIITLNNNNLKGKINMQFTNEDGKTIELYGEFETKQN